MVETESNENQDPPLSPLESEVDYDLYCDQVFEKLEDEQNPIIIDTKAQELLSLALNHRTFDHTERLQEFIFVSQLTMARLRRFAQEIKRQPDLVKQAEIIHMTYAQMYAHSMVELSKLANLL